MPHVPAKFQRGNLQAWGFERIAECGQLGKSVETLPAFADHITVEKLGQFPGHEETAPQQIGAGITGSVFENAGVFRRSEMTYDVLGDEAKTASEFFHRPKGPQGGGHSRHVAKTWVAGEQLV